MKRHILFICLICGFYSGVNAQTYYNMWRGFGEAGKPEWIANLSLATGDSYTGIGFTSGSICRGFVNGGGKWGFLRPGSTSDPSRLSSIISNISQLTVGVEGWVGAEGLSVRSLTPGTETTLDLVAASGKTSITSNVDFQGLHIQSVRAKRIYMYDDVLFNQKFWTSMGIGRNDDPTIDNPNNKMLRIGSTGSIGFWGNGQVKADDAPNLLITTEGKVRIGSNSNLHKLNIGGAIYLKQKNVETLVGVNSDSTCTWIGTLSNHGFLLGTNKRSCFYIDPVQRNLYVGITEVQAAQIREELKNKYGMFVYKGILSEDYAIAPKSTWADFVFSRNYNLKPLKEVESFIAENEHLPDVPSAAQVAEEGYSQHDMNKVLLQKIEELTLYIIKQQKEIEELKRR